MTYNLSPVIYSFLGSLGVCFISLYLYLFYQRKLYVLFWCGAWLVYLLRFLPEGFLEINSSWWVYFLFYTITLSHSFILLLAIYVYWSGRVPKKEIPWTLLVIILVSLALGFFYEGRESIKQIIFYINGLVNIVTGILLIVKYKGKKGIGVNLVGITLVLWGLHKFDYIYMIKYAGLKELGYFLAGMFPTLLAIGMTIMILDDNKEELEGNVRSMIVAFSTLIDARDAYTATHSHHVASYAQHLAKWLRLSNTQVSNIYLAGLLHDIGKIGIPDAILNKKSELTKAEFEIIKNHVSIGYKTLKDAGKTYGEVLSSVRYHHERWDGSGYPTGISGDAIPFGAQILSIADAFDAMISKRSYRLAMTVEQAKEELIRCKGTQFNPILVEGFVYLLESERLIEEDEQEENVS